MDVASDVIELFSTRDSHRAAELATKLERLNRERRDVEAAALTIIEARLASDAEIAADRLLVIDGDGWHRGVIGILASRVVERTAKPAIVVSVEDGPWQIAHGSGRSVDGFPLLAAIESCADLFTRFGGHAFAVGFALPAEKLPDLKRRLRVYADSISPRASPSACCAFTPSCRSTASRPCSPDGCASSSPSATATPSPSSSPAPRACSHAPRIMKAHHLASNSRRTRRPPSDRPRHCRPPAAQLLRPAAPRHRSIRAVGWNLAERAIELRLDRGSLIDVAYRIRENDHPDFGGLEIEIMGMRLAGS